MSTGGGEAQNDSKEEDDTDNRSKPSNIWCAYHEVTPATTGDETVVNSVVTEKVFSKVKFVDRDTDLVYSFEKKSICQFVISKCHLQANVKKDEWWRTARKYVAQTLNRLRNDRNTAMKWGF